MLGRLFAPAALLGALLLLTSNNVAWAAPTVETRGNPDFPSPYVDPFYRPPSNLSSFQPGQVIRRRTVPPAFLSLGGLKEASQVAYAYTNTSLQMDITVTSIYSPVKPVSPPVIMAYNNYEDATSFSCSPSWALVKNSGSPAAISTLIDQPIYINYALSKGWYVSVADHEGPKSAFIGGFQEGRAILDGIRATRNAEGLPQSTKVLITGYSGGGHASVWAVNLQPTYAPDVNVVGAAHGGTPVDPRSIFNFLNKGPFAGFALAGVSGLAAVYPDLDNFIISNLNAKGVEQFNKVRGPDFCLVNVVATYPFTNVYNFINVADPLNYPIPKRVLRQESLLRSVTDNDVAVPTYPRLLFHSLLDEIVPYADEAQYVRESCQRGANIQFQTFPISEHITGQVFGVPGVLLFLSQAVAGTTPKVICGTGLPDFKTVFSPDAAKIIGQTLLDQLKALNGKPSPFGGIIRFP